MYCDDDEQQLSKLFIFNNDLWVNFIQEHVKNYAVLLIH